MYFFLICKNLSSKLNLLYGIPVKKEFYGKKFCVFSTVLDSVENTHNYLS